MNLFNFRVGYRRLRHLNNRLLKISSSDLEITPNVYRFFPQVNQYNICSNRISSGVGSRRR